MSTPESFNVAIQFGDKTVPLGTVPRPASQVATGDRQDGYSIDVQEVDVFNQNKFIEETREVVLGALRDSLQGQLIPFKATEAHTPELISKLASSLAKHVEPLFQGNEVDVQPSEVDPGVYTFKAKMHTATPVCTYAFELKKPASMTDTEFESLCAQLKVELEAACQDT